jgi:hypothetical protein
LQFHIRSTAAGKLQISERLLRVAMRAAVAQENEDCQAEQRQSDKRSDHGAADHTCAGGRRS